MKTWAMVLLLFGLLATGCSSRPSAEVRPGSGRAPAPELTPQAQNVMEMHVGGGSAAWRDPPWWHKWFPPQQVWQASTTRDRAEIERVTAWIASAEVVDGPATSPRHGANLVIVTANGDMLVISQAQDCGPTDNGIGCTPADGQVLLSLEGKQDKRVRVRAPQLLQWMAGRAPP